MRPTYETAEDLTREAGVANLLSEAWNCKMIKNPKFYELDYSAVQGAEVKAFAEIKCRNKKYDTLILSLHKWQAALDMTEKTGKPVLIVSSVPEGIYWMQAAKKPVEIQIGGRKDRGDSEDMEPVVHIPYTWMTRL